MYAVPTVPTVPTCTSTSTSTHMAITSWQLHAIEKEDLEEKKVKKSIRT